MNTNIWAQIGLAHKDREDSLRRQQRLGPSVGSIAMQDDPMTTWASAANEGIGERHVGANTV